MKRTAILLLAALLLCAIGCGTGAKDDPNAVFIDPNAVRGGEYGALYFEVNGVRFGIYDEAEPVLSALSEKSSFTRESCAFDRPDVFHLFDSFEIMTNEIDGIDRITAITVKDDRVKTPQGLFIGMRETDAAAAFPALSDAGWNLADGTALLSVTVTDGVVRAIVYTPSIADD